MLKEYQSINKFVDNETINVELKKKRNLLAKRCLAIKDEKKIDELLEATKKNLHS